MAADKSNSWDWLISAAKAEGLNGNPAVPAGLPPAEAWEAIANTFGISVEELTQIGAKHSRLGVANFSNSDERALRLIPEKVARRYQVVPLRENDRNIVVATFERPRFEAEQAVEFAAGRKPIFELAPPKHLVKALDTAYSTGHGLESLVKRLGPDRSSVKIVVDVGPTVIARHEVEAPPIVNLTNMILRSAIEAGASDIHFEPGRQGGTVRYRVDGVMRDHMPLPMSALNPIVSRIKVLGRIDISDRLRPHDGKSRIKVEDRVYDLRISTVPTLDSEKAVIRILNPSATVRLEGVNFPGPEMRRLRQLAAFRDGIVAVTGPTGSGKTTTLYAVLQELNTGRTNITTIEDPVEYELQGVTQIQAEPKRNVTFASVLRSVLRQDPDVIFIGEIRDQETAEIAVQAAMTGHLVLTTLHTNDSSGVVARLTDIGLDRASIASTLRGVVGQRLVRRICTTCAQHIDQLTDGEAALAAAYGLAPTVRGAGCKECSKSGYRGRIPIPEVFVTTPELGDLIAAGARPSELERAAAQSGMRLMREVALDRVREGLTTLEEVDRVFGDSVDQPAPAEDKPKVLVVDDDSVTRLIARKILEEEGYAVEEATDGVAAVGLLGEGRSYNLIVLDLNMPRLSGRGVLKEVRSSPKNAGTSVVVLTGSNDEDETMLMDEGADDYIRKPLDPKRFASRVKAVLRRRS